MSILIRGMEMPKEGFVEILICYDGTVQQTGKSYRIDGIDYYTPYVGKMPVMCKAIPVPQHGRLIDADALKIEMMDENLDGYQGHSWREVGQIIDDAPTVIPAEECEK